MNNKRLQVMLAWKIALINCGMITLSAGFVKTPGFWTSYAADIAGPAMGYILIRGQFNSHGYLFNRLRLSPIKAALLIVSICFFIETAQYLNLYKAHFDPYDYIAYISLVIPLYLIDKWLNYQLNKSRKK